MILAFIVWAGALLPSSAQQTPSFQTRAELVTVPVTITDENGHFVDGVTRDDLNVFEDNVDREIVQFGRERVPISVSIVLDTSGSMSRMSGRAEKDPRWQDTRAAVTLFVGDLTDDDEISLSTFDSQPTLLVGWTRDHQMILNKLDRVQVSGGTAIYRAVMSAIRGMGRARNRRKVILLISDGIDHDRPDPPLVAQRLRQPPPSISEIETFQLQQRMRANLALQSTETTLYAFGMATGGKDFPVDLGTLRGLADPTRGYAMAMRTSDAIQGAITGLIDDLRAQYMLAFEPGDARDGKYHRITIKAHANHYRIRARAGYVASPER
ncbi:MAG TPA: VWA domain-containing protein [Vicinamibacterales bacterium]|nr:VWA domain-containing protein [Vicinamibacterales bacterium]